MTQLTLQSNFTSHWFPTNQCGMKTLDRVHAIGAGYAVDPPVEVSRFSALCDDNYEFLGASAPRLSRSFVHCTEIVRRAHSNF
jgi:hypothetical protein